MKFTPILSALILLAFGCLSEAQPLKEPQLEAQQPAAEISYLADAPSSRHKRQHACELFTGSPEYHNACSAICLAGGHFGDPYNCNGQITCVCR